VASSTAPGGVVEGAHPPFSDDLHAEVTVVDSGGMEAAPTGRLRSPGTSERSMSARSVFIRTAAALGLAVRGDDPLHELVADDVLAPDKRIES